MAFLGIGKYKDELKDLRKKASRDFNIREAGVDRMLDRISGRANEAYGSAEMGVNERYGDSLGRVKDSVADDRAGAQRSISRALMASGGDITGEGATALSRVTEAGNNAISNAIRGYTDMSNQDRKFDLNRGDRFTLSELGSKENLMNMSLGQLMNANNLERDRRQANRQLWGDVIGGIGSVTGGLLSSRNNFPDARPTGGPHESGSLFDTYDTGGYLG